jgi:hypothetical protein
MTDVFRSLCVDLVRIADALDSGKPSAPNQGQALDGFSALANFRALADTARKKLAKSEQPESGLPSDGGYEVGTMWAGHGTRPEPVGRPVWTEGVCGDGAAILKDGVMQPIEDVIAALNAADRSRPEPLGPTDEELLAVQGEGTVTFPRSHPEAEALSICEYYKQLEIRKGRAVLQRWGRSTPQPIPVSERPWEREGFCDAEGRCWFSVQAVAGHCWHLWPRQKWLPGTGYCLPHWALPIPTTDNIQ